jgi:hypothetical protein
MTHRSGSPLVATRAGVRVAGVRQGLRRCRPDVAWVVGRAGLVALGAAARSVSGTKPELGVLLDHPVSRAQNYACSRRPHGLQVLTATNRQGRYGPPSASIATRRLGLESLEHKCPNRVCRPARSAARGGQRSAAIRHRRDAHLGGSFFTRKQIANVDQKSVL